MWAFISGDIFIEPATETTHTMFNKFGTIDRSQAGIHWQKQMRQDR